VRLAVLVATSAMNAVRLGSYSSRSTVAETSHLRRLKSMIAIALLVTAGDAARGHMALVVAAAGLVLAFGQRLDGLALPKRDGRPGSGRGGPDWSAYML
jgi:hypothetical protein